MLEEACVTLQRGGKPAAELEEHRAAAVEEESSFEDFLGPACLVAPENWLVSWKPSPSSGACRAGAASTSVGWVFFPLAGDGAHLPYESGNWRPGDTALSDAKESSSHLCSQVVLSPGFHLPPRARAASAASFLTRLVKRLQHRPFRGCPAAEVSAACFPSKGEKRQLAGEVCSQRRLPEPGCCSAGLQHERVGFGGFGKRDPSP